MGSEMSQIVSNLLRAANPAQIKPSIWESRSKTEKQRQRIGSRKLNLPETQEDDSEFKCPCVRMAERAVGCLLALTFCCMLTFLQLLISFNDFCRFYTQIMWSTKKGSFTFFHFWSRCLFISFSCLIALTSASSAMLNSSGKSSCPYLIPTLRNKTFSLSLLGTMLYPLSSWEGILLVLIYSEFLWVRVGFLSNFCFVLFIYCIS